MYTIDETTLKRVDYQTGAVISKEKAITVTDNKQTLVFCKDRILAEIDDIVKELNKAENIVTERKGKETYIYARICKDKDKALEQCEIMRKIVEEMTPDKLTQIMDGLPRYKNGNIKNSEILVYSTGISLYYGEPGAWCNITALNLCIASAFELPDDNNGTKYYTFLISTEKPYDKTEKAIIDNNLEINKVELDRKSYLKPTELVPGMGYMDAKDREFLFIGKLIMEESIQNSAYDFVFLKITDKIKKEFSKVKDFEEWLNICLKRGYAKGNRSAFHLYNTFKISKAFKVINETQQYFTVDQMRCSFDTEDECFIDVPAEGPEILYEVHVYSEHYSWYNTIFRTHDKDERDRKYKEYKENYKDRKFKKADVIRDHDEDQPDGEFLDVLEK